MHLPIQLYAGFLIDCMIDEEGDAGQGCHFSSFNLRKIVNRKCNASYVVYFCSACTMGSGDIVMVVAV